MGLSTKISLISFIFLTVQSFVLLSNAKSLQNGKVKFENSNTTEETLTLIPRQEEEDIREYESIPRVVASVSKIFKGVVSGNVHDIFHGAFSFAPVDVSKRLISVYNQVVGFPATTTTSEAPEKVISKGNSTKIATTGSNSTEVLSELSESGEFLPEDEEDDEDEEDEEEEFKRRNLNKNTDNVPPPAASAQATSPPITSPPASSPPETIKPAVTVAKAAT